MSAHKENTYAQKGAEKASSVVVMRIPTSLKAKWVHQSQKEGLTLTGWIVKKLE